MNDDAGGWLWLIIDVLFVAALAVAIGYGTLRWRWRRKDRAFEAVREAETRAQYEREARRETMQKKTAVERQI